MNHRRRLLNVCAGVAAAVLCGTAVLAAPPPVEMARIERLLVYIETRRSIEFVRNGTAYSAADAAKFLRGKFEKMGDEVRTARQFIDQICSKSSMSGEPYMVRHADGHLTPAGAMLHEELARIEAAERPRS